MLDQWFTDHFGLAVHLPVVAADVDRRHRAETWSLMHDMWIELQLVLGEVVGLHLALHVADPFRPLAQYLAVCSHMRGENHVLARGTGLEGQAEHGQHQPSSYIHPQLLSQSIYRRCAEESALRKVSIGRGAGGR
ncbi:hypothetical protein WR25_07322 [Diploscapter pachys]|uniref:Uncharacterized protein n=1 Tax=Diploscapter pachys TaxID=2018661 RepID=A0A2A2KGT2_9BILA|nr:hypothetical protein WR25_07322 [Diploscapter pachys]